MLLFWRDFALQSSLLLPVHQQIPYCKKSGYGTDALESWLLGWRCCLCGVAVALEFVVTFVAIVVAETVEAWVTFLVMFSAVVPAEAVVLLVMLAAGAVAEAADVPEAVVLAASMVAAM